MVLLKNMYKLKFNYFKDIYFGSKFNLFYRLTAFLIDLYSMGHDENTIIDFILCNFDSPFLFQ